MRKDQNYTIPDIIFREITGKITEEEREVLKEWISLSENNRSLYNKLTSEENLLRVLNTYEDIDDRRAWDKINSSMSRRNIGKGYSLRRVLRYAAIIVMPLLVASYLFYQKSQVSEPDSVFDQLTDQIASSDESLLIISTGERVSLNQARRDSRINIDGAYISQADSIIVYEKSPVSSGKDVKYNTLVTPVARVFSVLLPDGTRVWLNASSAIRYPVSFSSRERRVFLTGEAFFEVAPDNSKPFIVSTRELEVTATGTSFNVMAYPDDNYVEATLVSGEVRVQAAKQSLILKPGNQASLDLSTKSLDAQSVDTEHYTSWVAGKYIFEHTNLEEVMTKLSRWYDFKVSFTTDEELNFHFTGILYKYEDLNLIFSIIEKTANIRIIYTGEEVLVTKK